MRDTGGTEMLWCVCDGGRCNDVGDVRSQVGWKWLPSKIQQNPNKPYTLLETFFWGARGETVHFNCFLKKLTTLPVALVASNLPVFLNAQNYNFFYKSEDHSNEVVF